MARVLEITDKYISVQCDDGSVQKFSPMFAAYDVLVGDEVELLNGCDGRAVIVKSRPRKFSPKNIIVKICYTLKK